MCSPEVRQKLNDLAGEALCIYSRIGRHYYIIYIIYIISRCNIVYIVRGNELKFTTTLYLCKFDRAPGVAKR